MNAEQAGEALLDQAHCLSFQGHQTRGEKRKKKETAYSKMAEIYSSSDRTMTDKTDFSPIVHTG